MNTAAERMKMVREMLHLNKSELAVCLGISCTLISMMELGKTNVTWKTAHLLEAKFEINPKWLEYGEGNMFISEDMSVERILDKNPMLKRLYELRSKQFASAEEKLRLRVAKVERREQIKQEAADRMRRIRDAFNINQNQLAKRLGVTRSYINAVETGRERPSLRMAKMIEADFGVSANWLLYGVAA